MPSSALTRVRPCLCAAAARCSVGSSSGELSDQAHCQTRSLESDVTCCSCAGPLGWEWGCGERDNGKCGFPRTSNAVSLGSRN